jgi:hypothetical protein
MKKALILFLAFCLVSVGVFADEGKVDFSVSGSASVTWGIDLNDTVHGFKNDASSSISITFVDTASKEKGGEGVYGYIKVADFGATGFALAGGSVEAKIVVDPIFIQFAGKPEDGVGFAGAIGGATDVALAASSAISGGLKIGMSNGMVNAFILSRGDWTAATQSLYTFGLCGEIAFAPITFAYDFAMQDTVIGFGVKPSVSLADVVNGLDLYVAFDGVNGASFAYDLAAGVTLNFSAPDGDGNKSNFAAAFYMNSSNQMAFTVDVTELAGDNGVVPGIGAGVGFAMDLFGTNPWSLYADVNYTTADFYVYEEFDYTSAGLIALTAGIDLKTLITNMTFGLKYVSTDFRSDNGTVTVTASISL